MLFTERTGSIDEGASTDSNLTRTVESIKKSLASLNVIKNVNENNDVSIKLRFIGKRIKRVNTLLKTLVKEKGGLEKLLLPTPTKDSSSSSSSSLIAFHPTLLTDILDAKEPSLVTTIIECSSLNAVWTHKINLEIARYKNTKR
jgi:hypothetical protein